MDGGRQNTKTLVAGRGIADTFLDKLSRNRYRKYMCACPVDIDIFRPPAVDFHMTGRGPDDEFRCICKAVEVRFLFQPQRSDGAYGRREPEQSVDTTKSFQAPAVLRQGRLRVAVFTYNDGRRDNDPYCINRGDWVAAQLDSYGMAEEAARRVRICVNSRPTAANRRRLTHALTMRMSASTN